MELRDKKGLTEAEFLAAYQKKNYPRPYLTADIVLFRKGTGQVLLIRRGGHPFLGCWALPGGFVNRDESAEAAAARELCEETGVSGLPLRQLKFYSTPGRDPRGWVVSAAFLAETDRTARAGDDAAEAAWFFAAPTPDGYRLTAGTEEIVLRTGCAAAPGLAFDHAAILLDALAAREKAGSQSEENLKKE